MRRDAAARRDPGSGPARRAIRHVRKREVRQRRARRARATGRHDLVRILLVNWQDHENPQAGGAEIHLHEIFGRLVARGHRSLFCAAGGRMPPRAPSSTASTFIASARGTPFRFWPADTTRPISRRWLRRAHRGHQQGSAVHAAVGSEEAGRARAASLRRDGLSRAPLPLAAAVWLSERPLSAIYRGVPFQAISESTADDLVARGIPRGFIRVIYPGVDSSALTPDPAERSPTPLFVVSRPAQEVQEGPPRHPRVRRTERARRDARDRRRGRLSRRARRAGRIA